MKIPYPKHDGKFVVGRNDGKEEYGKKFNFLGRIHYALKFSFFPRNVHKLPYIPTNRDIYIDECVRGKWTMPNILGGV